MIKTALKTTAVTATIAGLSFIAAGPALANGAPDNWNSSQANGNVTYVSVFGGGEGSNTCAAVSLANQNPSSCNGNQTYDDTNQSFND